MFSCRSVGIVFVAAMSVGACKRDGSTPAGAVPPVLALTPVSASIFPGDSLALRATIDGVAVSQQTLVWVSSDPSVATVNTQGVVRALKGSPGISVCASSASDSSIRACAAIIVLVKGTPAFG